MFSATKVFIIICFLGIVFCYEAFRHPQLLSYFFAWLPVITPGHAITSSNRYQFEVRYSSHTRLCTNKTMLTINGQFPGPTIYARRGDLVIVDVINLTGHNITIHWHGVKMPRYPWADGPAFITQCPISPGTRFSQRVVLSDEEGTLWWHAHSEWSRASVYGAFVILPPTGESYPFPKPHAEVPILLGEWWNADVQGVMEKFLINGADPDPSDAFLINGQPGDLYNCSQADMFKLSVEYGKTYMIRMVNSVMSYIMFFRIANHSFTVVGSDGAYTKPLRSDYIAISPGQTIDFLMEANQPPSRYYMASRLLVTQQGFTDSTMTTGFLDYAGNYTVPASPPLPSLPPLNSTDASYNFTKQLRSLANLKYPVDVPKNITHTFLYTLSINLRPCPNDSCAGPFGERLLASVNNVTFQLPKTDILQAYYRGIDGVYQSNFPDNPPFEFNYTYVNLPMDLSLPQNGTEVKVLEFNATVELVFQGTHLAGGLDHPMHLHGHSFYVVGSGFGNFNRTRDPANYNLVDPPLVETITVPRNGWSVIRFKANNPGVWYMHCHLERHNSWGMAMVFIVRDGIRPEEKMLPPPPDMPLC